jgi:hypothetical protein
MEDFGGWLDTRAQQLPASRNQLMASAARYLKIDVNELPRVLAACRVSAAALRQIESDAHQNWLEQSKDGKLPDVAIVQGFVAKRQAAIRSGADQLRAALSVNGWSGLQGYINGEHRSSVHKQP